MLETTGKPSGVEDKRGCTCSAPDELVCENCGAIYDDACSGRKIACATDFDRFVFEEHGLVDGQRGCCDEGCDIMLCNVCGESFWEVNALVGISVISRLEAAERHYRPRYALFADGLKHAIEIAQEDGWQHIAPAWIKTNDQA